MHLEFDVFFPDCRLGRSACAGRVVSFHVDESFPLARRMHTSGVRNYEPETLATIMALLELENDFSPRAGKVEFLDVGANIGLFSIAAKAIFGDAVEVSAFEPFPDAAGTLKNVCRLNDLDVLTYQVAVAEADGAVELLLSSSANSHSLVKNERKHQGERLAVQAVTLDSILRDHDDGPCITKLDTEGNEPAILRAAEQLLARRRPWITVEILSSQAASELQEIAETHGYSLYHMTPADQWEPAASLRPAEEYRNWLLAPRPLPDDFFPAKRRWQTGLLFCRTPQAPERRGVRFEAIASSSVHLEPGTEKAIYLRSSNGIFLLWGNHSEVACGIAFVMRKNKSSATKLFGGAQVHVAQSSPTPNEPDRVCCYFPAGGWCIIRNGTDRVRNLSYLIVSDV